MLNMRAVARILPVARSSSSIMFLYIEMRSVWCLPEREFIGWNGIPSSFALACAAFFVRVGGTLLCRRHSTSSADHSVSSAVFDRPSRLAMVCQRIWKICWLMYAQNSVIMMTSTRI